MTRNSSSRILSYNSRRQTIVGECASTCFLLCTYTIEHWQVVKKSLSIYSFIQEITVSAYYVQALPKMLGIQQWVTEHQRGVILPCIT